MEGEGAQFEEEALDGMEQVEEEASSSLTSYPLLNIKVKTMVPAEHDLSIGSGSTIRDLKLEVERVSGVEVDRQRILFCGRVLAENDKTLEESGIKDGHVLHMVERPPDVPPQPRNNVPPQPSQTGGLPPGNVQRIAIGTINSGPGAAEAPANVDRLISGLISALGNSIGNPAGVSPANLNVGPGGQGVGGPAAGAGGAPGSLPLGVEVQQVEINIDAGPPGLGGARVAGDARSEQRHPLEALDSFISQMGRIMEAHRESLDENGRRPVVDQSNHGPGSSNSGARHFAVECDICGACPIRGARYKSLAHDNYDLCEHCVRTEAAREQEPYVQVEIPMCNQIPYTSLTARSRADRPEATERMRAAVTSVLGEQSGGEEVNWDRTTVSALCELLSRTGSLMTTQVNDYIAQQVSSITSQLEEVGDLGGRHSVQGSLVQTSSMMNALGGIFVEMGRLFGGLHLPVPSQPSSSPFSMGNNLGYISHNGSQVNVPPPMGGMDRFGLLPYSGIRIPVPLRSQPPRPPANTGGPAPPAAPPAAAPPPSAPPASTQGTEPRVGGDAQAGTTGSAEQSAQGPGPRIGGQVVTIENMEQLLLQRSNDLLQQMNNDSPVVDEEPGALQGAAGTPEPEPSTSTTPSPEVETPAEEKEEKEEEEEKQEEEKQEEEKQEKKGPPGAAGLGLGGGLGLGPRRKKVEKKKEEKDPPAPGAAGLGLGGGLGLGPRRKKVVTRKKVVQRPKKPEPATGEGSSLQGLMSSMSSILGGPPMKEEKEEEEESFEESMRALSEEDQKRWAETIQEDELEQEEMRMMQFSEAYRSLDNV
ncbi:hypothetical protein HOP50_11g63530 [Chloropicon primus]|nr:hypothetical protein HOP50_11g63530 [Chloropicon primus]